MSQRQITPCEQVRRLVEATCSNDTSQRQIASSVNGEFFVKITLQHNFVAATCCKKSNQTEFMRVVAATKFHCRDKHFHKISPVHTKRFVAAICRCDVSPRHVVATCQSPDLFTRSDLLSRLVAATCRLVCTEVLVWS